MLRLALCLLAASVASASAEPLVRFAGQYRGCAVSGGEWVPIETVLTVAGGSLSGSYLFIESTGRSVSGEIVADGAVTGAGLELRWRDLYGEGPASFTFAPDGSRFDGFWTTDGGEDRFTWFGVRLGGPGTDCRTPVS